MPASLTDVVTIAQNIVQAISAQTQNTLNLSGTKTVPAINSATVVKTTPGRICRVSVTVAGSTPGMIYDGTLPTTTTSPLWVVPNSVSITDVNLPTTYGIVVIPGTGQTVSVSFS
jgi:hypothetical protein